MNFEDFGPALCIRQAHGDLPIESARSQQGLIEHVWNVGGRQNNDASVSLEAVHFREQLVDGLFSLIVSHTQSLISLPTDRVKLINENDAGRVLLGLFEHVSYSGGADTDEHLNELRCRDGEEGNACFTCYCLRQKCLTCSWWTNKKGPSWNFGSEIGEFRGCLQEVNDLHELFLGFVDSGDSIEVDTGIRLHLHSGFGLTHVELVHSS